MTAKSTWVTSFWDDGFYVRLGDEMNGYRVERRCATWAEAECWLDEQARVLYPDSVRPRRLMFVVDEQTAAAIRRAFNDSGELAAVVELRRHFPRSRTTSRRGLACGQSLAGSPCRPIRPVRADCRSAASERAATGFRWRRTGKRAAPSSRLQGKGRSPSCRRTTIRSIALSRSPFLGCCPVLA
jgi:hypothetical protein